MGDPFTKRWDYWSITVIRYQVILIFTLRLAICVNAQGTDIASACALQIKLSSDILHAPYFYDGRYFINVPEERILTIKP